jgi:hypothetical protein
VTITPHWRLRIIAALLVVAAVLFVIGVASEPNEDSHSEEPGGEVAGHPEADETAEARASESSEGTEPAAFAILDIAEVGHQLDEDRTGLAVLAATIAALHAAATALAVWRLTARAPTTRPA